MRPFIGDLLAGEEGQDIAEYAVMLATILILIVGTAQLVGSKSNTVFSTVARILQSAPSDRD
jgi:Flp pilus assembly pilin Flp